jgi:hypothetical protein
MPLAPLVAALLVLAVAVSIAAEPRAPHSPPRLALTGNLAAFVSLAPKAVARIRGDK